ncbi:maleylpyruvate isomerase family mycothiol-dependent enzyme [Spirillospora sp. CA-255316]
MALSDRPAERHRQVAGLFTDRVRGTRSWDTPSPVAGWSARDIVRHLTEWFPGFLASGAGIRLRRGPSVEENPVAAWQVHCDGVQAVLDDPQTAHWELTNPHIGSLPLETAIDRFYTADVFMHIWDLSRATGQDDRLDPDFCAQLLSGMEPMEQVLRSSGQYGPRVEWSRSSAHRCSAASQRASSPTSPRSRPSTSTSTPWTSLRSTATSPPISARRSTTAWPHTASCSTGSGLTSTGTSRRTTDTAQT